MPTPAKRTARTAGTAGQRPPDRRLERGARSRSTVLRRAVDAASLNGLDGLSFGRLAEDTGMSKAGIQTLFGTKEALQLATVATARDMFVEAVVLPARASPPGLARLRHLVERWISYAEEPLFEGGCLRVANLAEYDSKPGAVQAALLRDQQEWLGLLRNQITAAVAAGETAPLDVDLAVFTLDAVLCAANTALRMGDETAVAKVRRLLDAVVPPLPPARSKTRAPIARGQRPAPAR